jgi:hypothetical protein
MNKILSLFLVFSSLFFYSIASYNQVFQKSLNFSLFLHIKKFNFKKLDCHLQYMLRNRKKLMLKISFLKYFSKRIQSYHYDMTPMSLKDDAKYDKDRDKDINLQIGMDISR